MEAVDSLSLDSAVKHFDVNRGFLMKSSGQVRAVDGVSLELNPGETTALVGESGCGKTTVSRLFLRLLPLTTGKLLLGGEDIWGMRGKDLRKYRTIVQAVFQDPYSSLNPQKRVRDIVAEPLELSERSLTKNEVGRRVSEALERVGLRPEQAKNFPHEFSGGQRQRIAIASAIASNPLFIILDEPVSALDVSIGAQILNLLRDLQEERNISYLLISHSLAQTRFMSNVTAVMYLGKVVERGETGDLFERPIHPYTIALFSSELPLHPRDSGKLPVGMGEIASPINMPSGCTFHPRCPWAKPGHCDQEAPELRYIESESRYVACHYAEEVIEVVRGEAGAHEESVHEFFDYGDGLSSG